MATSAEQRRYRQRYGTVTGGAYDGTAVRRLEREEVLQPRPRTRERQRELERPKIRVREAGGVSLFAVTGVAAVAVFAVLLLFSMVELNTLSSDMVSIRNQVAVLQSEEAVLRAQYEMCYDLSTIEENVLSSGAMVKPQEGQMIYVDQSEPDVVTRYGEENRPGLAGLLDSARGVLANLMEYFN